MPRKICSMGRLGAYKVDLKGQENPEASYQWTIDSDFFAALDAEEVRNGHLSVNLTVTKEKGEYLLLFDIKGDAIVQCDRCLDDMSLPIETSGDLKVRLGADFADDGDVVIVPEQEGTINVSWYIYEFIALAIPLKHVHAPGKCNKEMTEQLNRHLAPEPGDDEQNGPVDTRWDQLKDLNIED